jgi:hypothetical protein
MFARVRKALAPALARAASAVAPRSPNQANPPSHPYDAGPPARARVVAEDGVIVSRVDGWQNLTTGMGDPSRDKLTYGNFAPVSPLDYGEIESLYYGDDMCERIVDSLPDEAFRRGFTLEGPNAEEVLKAFKLLCVDTKVRDGFAWARLWGGAALVLGSTTARPKRSRWTSSVYAASSSSTSSIAATSTRSRTTRTRSRPNFGKPEIYQVTPAFGNPGTRWTANSNILIHETRLIKFNGTRIDDITTRRLAAGRTRCCSAPTTSSGSSRARSRRADSS